MARSINSLGPVTAFDRGHLSGSRRTAVRADRLPRSPPTGPSAHCREDPPDPMSHVPEEQHMTAFKPSKAPRISARELPLGHELGEIVQAAAEEGAGRAPRRRKGRCRLPRLVDQQDPRWRGTPGARHRLHDRVPRQHPGRGRVSARWASPRRPARRGGDGSGAPCRPPTRSSARDDQSLHVSWLMTIRAGARGLGPERRIVLLHGPVSSAKSTIARIRSVGDSSTTRGPKARSTPSTGTWTARSSPRR